MRLADLSLEESAKATAGNWRKFHCFVWFRDRELDDADNWAIFYTHNRDSGLLDQSNAAVIHDEMTKFGEGEDPDVVFESHSHWAVGHVDGFSVRVFKDGRITEAFRKYYELEQQMDAYPVLDDSDYSDREYEATLDNIKDAAWRLKSEVDLPDGWEGEVYSWLSDHECNEIENVDDRGGYPSEEALRRAFEALGYDTAQTC
jgi:hypothetical protein